MVVLSNNWWKGLGPEEEKYEVRKLFWLHWDQSYPYVHRKLGVDFWDGGERWQFLISNNEGGNMDRYMVYARDSQERGWEKWEVGGGLYITPLMTPHLS